MKVILGGLSFCYKLYIGIVFISTLILLYPLFIVILSRKKWRKYSFPLNIFWSYLVRLLMFIWVKKTGGKDIPKGPYMILANHTSYFDIFLMYSILPQHPFLFMGKSEILSYPLLKTFFKRLNIPVFRKDRLKAARSFIQAKQCLAEGWAIVIFPEGGIPDLIQPNMAEFKEGAFKMAKSMGVPIVPVTFLDNYHLFSDPEFFLGPAHPGIARIVIHPTISVEEIQQATELEMMQRTFDCIAQPLRAKGLMN